MIADLESRGLGTRVLIAEDHVDSATGIGRLLRLHGYEVAIVTDGRDAVRTATRFVPQAALIDLTLPGLDGFEVARQLRGQVTTRDCRLIAMTGWTADEYADRARAAGFDEHLVKPISLDSLLQALATVPATSTPASPWPSEQRPSRADRIEVQRTARFR
jgi:two-component system CheB/CheR fusion protein